MKNNEIKLLNMGLNEGSYCSNRCIEILQAKSGITSLRRYPASDNLDLKKSIAKECGEGVKPENIFLHNGTGPIIKLAIPYIIKSKIKSSVKRIVKHLVNKNGYPIITSVLSYFKAVKKGLDMGLTIYFIPLTLKDNKYCLNENELTRVLNREEGLVYLCNPNNPTGSILIEKNSLELFLKKYTETVFWIDEAYVEYLSPIEHEYITPLAIKYPNLICSRTFSFAYGLAATHVGYIVTSEYVVKKLENEVTNYRIPALIEEIILAALSDKEHLNFVREKTKEARNYIYERLGKYDYLIPYESKTNFILVKITNGISAKRIFNELLNSGIKIKIFEPIAKYEFPDMFRITIGTPYENTFLMDKLDNILIK
jgi:histidinol-phosphate aminotransferase